MAIVKQDDILAYHVYDKIACPDCITKEELDNVKEDDVIEEDPDSEDLIFCDRCRNKLN